MEIYTYILIYIDRERERERERKPLARDGQSYKHILEGSATASFWTVVIFGSFWNTGDQARFGTRVFFVVLLRFFLQRVFYLFGGSPSDMWFHVVSMFFLF